MAINKHPDVWVKKVEKREPASYLITYFGPDILHWSLVKYTELEPDLPAVWLWAIFFHSVLPFPHCNVVFQYLPHGILVFYMIPSTNCVLGKC